MTIIQPKHTPEHNASPVKDLWFEDGNLILKAENSLFRIYTGLLAARSSVFKDMLAFPPPAEGNEMLDGCLIVTVYDNAKDMVFFLKAIFDSSFFEPPPSPTELPIVKSVLHLSLKYDVPYLRRRAQLHLSTTFPTTLSAWKVRDETRTIPPVENTPFAALLLARQFDLPWLIPSILYCISTHAFEKTLDHALWGEEQIFMDWVDKRMSILGRQKILLRQAGITMAMARLGGVELPGCTGEANTCQSTRLSCANILGRWDVAGFLDYPEEHRKIFTTFCSTCLAQFEELCDANCEMLWNDLPEIFGLPDWEVLEKERVRALE